MDQVKQTAFVQEFVAEIGGYTLNAKAKIDLKRCVQTWEVRSQQCPMAVYEEVMEDEDSYTVTRDGVWYVTRARFSFAHNPVCPTIEVESKEGREDRLERELQEEE